MTVAQCDCRQISVLLCIVNIYFIIKTCFPWPEPRCTWYAVT